MSIIEIVAVILGVTNVYLIIRQNIWCWPVGIAMVALYVYIFFDARLYSDMGLQVIYIFLQIYGWYFWLHGGRERTVPAVTRLSTAEIAIWSVVSGVGTFALGFTMANYTDADLPYWDALTTVLSLVAQYHMARKKLESWLVWVTVDVFSIAIYAYKDLTLTAGLYAVFLCLATTGFFVWRKNFLGMAVAAERA